MNEKTWLYDVADVLVIMFATSSIFLIIAKLYNLNFVKDIDSTILVGIPASIFAYFTYIISKKQTYQTIIKQYTEHMQDFFDTWTKYHNSFPLPKYLESIKNRSKDDNIESLEGIIPNYSELKNKLLILNLRAEKFAAKEITSAMAKFWQKFRDSETQLLSYAQWYKLVSDIESNYKNSKILQISGNQVDIEMGVSYQFYLDKRREASEIVRDNVMFFFINGINEMNNAYDQAIRRLQ